MRTDGRNQDCGDFWVYKGSASGELWEYVSVDRVEPEWIMNKIEVEVRKWERKSDLPSRQWSLSGWIL